MEGVCLTVMTLPKTKDVRRDYSLSELFTLRQASKILKRTVFCVWYHAVNNLSMTPTTKGRNMYLTKDDLRLIASEHMRLKKDEVREEILNRIESAVST